MSKLTTLTPLSVMMVSAVRATDTTALLSFVSCQGKPVHRWYWRDWHRDRNSVEILTNGGETAMDANNLITAAVFSAFLKCPTKAHLLMIGAPNPGTFFADIETRISSMYKVAAQRRLCAEIEFDQTLDFGHMDYSLNHEGVPRFVDCKTAVYDSVLPPYKPKGHRSQESAPSKTLLPLLFLPWDKPELSDSLLMCFGALALTLLIC